MSTTGAVYERILLPTDSADGAAQATAHAIDLATQHDAELHLLYVVDSDVYASYPGDEYVHEREGIESALMRIGREALAGVADRARAADVDPEIAVRRGVPHERILAYADEVDVDLLVLGSTDRPGAYRQLLGSVTDRVSRLSSRPTMIVKTPVERRETPEQPPTRRGD